MGDGYRDPVVRPLVRAVVLGSGVMGSRIAALLAGFGVQVDLLDVMEPAGSGEAVTSRALRAQQGLAALTKSRPPTFYDPGRDPARIRPGTLEDDLDCVNEADWVIEAVVEDLAVKRSLWARVFACLAQRPRTDPERRLPVLSTNTSGLPLRAIFQDLAEGTPEATRLVGAHFFNPPRYMRLVELIGLPTTSPDTLETVRVWAERDLGKTVVQARDTPDFIANRIGAYALHVTLAEMDAQRARVHSGEAPGPALTPEAVDALTGPVIGHPPSATFRTLDLVGLDTSMRVSEGLRTYLEDPDERRVFAMPAILEALIGRGLLGEKTGAGFYRRVPEKGADGRRLGRSRIEVIDLDSLTYRERHDLTFPSLGRARQEPSLVRRLVMLAYADDEAGRFVWHVLSRVMLYAAQHAQEIAGGDLVAIDRAMRAGYEWELGPFETWGALGLSRAAARLRAEGQALPAFIEAAVERGQVALYDPWAEAHGRYRLFPVWRIPLWADVGGRTADAASQEPASTPGGAGTPGANGAPPRLVRRLGSTTWLDIGDDVLAVLMHPDHQAIGPYLVEELHAAARETKTRWRGLVLTAPSRQRFLVGANLALVLAAAEEGDFDSLDRAVRAVQTLHLELRYLPRPVIATPLGFALGGGAELCLHCDGVVTTPDLVMGQVEVGAGLVPAGGATVRLLDRVLRDDPWAAELPWAPFLTGGAVQAGVGASAFTDPAPRVSRLFQQLALATTSQSAAEARSLGMITAADRVIASPEGVLDEARSLVLELDRRGYRPPEPLPLSAPGREVRALLDVAVDHLHRAGQATDVDAHIAHALAHVLCGGDVAMGTALDEWHFLDLEREAFLRLCGERGSQDRMRALLATGRPLRN